MNTYKIALKGTKKNNTEDITIELKGDNIGQAFSWAYMFFQKGEFLNPYFAKGINQECGGTEEFIPGSSTMKHLAGKYFVPRSGIVRIN